MDNTHVSDEIFAILANNHKLRLPKFLVIRDNVVVRLSFTDLVHSLGTIDGDFEVFKLFGIHSFESHVKFVCSSLVWKRFKYTTAEIDLDVLFSS